MFNSKSNATMVCGLSCAFCINSSNNVVVIGSNEHGKLACNKDEKVIFPPRELDCLSNIKMIACGDNHCVFLDFEGYLYTTGSNLKGELGCKSKKISFNCIPQRVNLPLIDSFACGRYFTMCITNNGEVYGFGDNTNGQIGIGKDKQICYTPKKLKSLKNIELIECGEAFVLCKSIDNKYYGWGIGSSGQFGNDAKDSYNKPQLITNYPKDIISFKCGDKHTLLLSTEGKVYSFGYNNYGQLGLDENGDDVKIPTLISDLPDVSRVECGFHHSICLDLYDNVWTFGWNGYGQLGVGDVKNRYKPTPINEFKDAITISAGGVTTYVKTSTGIYASGYNDKSQIGIEGKSTHSKPIKTFIDNNDMWLSNNGKSRAKSARK